MFFFLIVSPRGKSLLLYYNNLESDTVGRKSIDVENLGRIFPQTSHINIGGFMERCFDFWKKTATSWKIKNASRANKEKYNLNHHFISSEFSISLFRGKFGEFRTNFGALPKVVKGLVVFHSLRKF